MDFGTWASTGSATNRLSRQQASARRWIQASPPTSYFPLHPSSLILLHFFPLRHIPTDSSGRYKPNGPVRGHKDVLHIIIGQPIGRG